MPAVPIKYKFRGDAKYCYNTATCLQHESLKSRSLLTETHIYHMIIITGINFY